MLVTQKPLPFAVSDVRVASVTGHKERASGISVGERIASFHGLVCWRKAVYPPKAGFFCFEKFIYTLDAIDVGSAEQWS